MPLNYKKIALWVVLALIIAGIAAWLIYRFTVEKSLGLRAPEGSEVLLANETFKITWKSRNISRVGIILIKGAEGQDQDVSWIARDVPARKGSFDWQIFAWQEPRQDYKIAIFEYPWQEGNLIDRSDDFFTILGPQFASCDSLSVATEWPFVPSDFPEIRKVFITSREYAGNLERLEGADQKCQTEAEEKGFEGQWKAFLGDDTVFARDRLNLSGVFVAADSSGAIPEGKSCHRLLGNNFDEFFKKMSEPLSLNRQKFEEKFLQDLQNIWLGRITKESLRECTTISFGDQTLPRDLARNYSFTTTCQNWTTNLGTAPGYPPEPGQEIEFPACFTPQGVKTVAAGIAGLASGVVGEKGQEVLSSSLGKSCNTTQKLLCVQQ